MNTTEAPATQAQKDYILALHTSIAEADLFMAPTLVTNPDGSHRLPDYRIAALTLGFDHMNGSEHIYLTKSAASTEIDRLKAYLGRA